MQCPALVRELPLDAAIEGEPVGPRLPLTSVGAPRCSDVHTIVEPPPVVRELALSTLEERKLADQSVQLL